MAGKFRFTVPKADEMGSNESEIKPMSLFENYKKQKDGTSMKKTEQTLDRAQKQESIRRNEINTGDLKQSSTPSTQSVISSKSSNNSAVTSTATTSVQKQAQSTTSEALASNATDTKATTGKTASSSSIIVNFRQRGNPILKHIRNVPWEYSSIIPDYVMGKATCALYLSLRYHQLNPSYIHNRLKELGKGYDLRVLLAQVDVKDPHHLLKDLAKICILADLTLILAFSPEEAGRYLETYKVYENKPPDVLMEKIDKDYVSKLTDTLTSVKSVNKTDSMTLLSTFKTMKGIINASKEDLSLCAGFGPQKAQRLHDVFHEPFLKSKKRLAGTSTENDSDVKKKPR